MTSNDPGAPRPKSILIVEDERIVAKDLQLTLRELGYDAFAIASSSDQAIARASERCPDLVLMDIRIDGERDGVQTAEILKRDFGLPVIYLTAHADETTLERAKKTEPHGYLLKPVKTAELRSAIEVCLYKHEMETRLRDRERWFSTTLESIADAVITVDLGGRVTFMNRAAEALTGTTAHSAVGQLAREVLQLHPEQLAPPSESRAASSQESRLLNVATGAHHYVDDSSSPVISEGQTLGAVMVFRDVTQQKGLQKQLELADRLATLGTMAAGVAHELNNPLAVALTNADYLASELGRAGSAADSGKALRLAELSQAAVDLQTATRQIRSVIDDLRAFTRPSAQRSSGIVNVSECIAFAVRNTAREFQDRARVLTKVFDVPAVKADEARLGQVLINLLVNAAQAIAPGSIDRNSVTVSSYLNDRGMVVIEVRDTGAGIAPEIQERIFDPFFTTKAPEVSSGLGLSICRGIVASFSGELQVESDAGRGACFSVLLPAVVRESLPASARASTSRSPQQRARILVLDDEPMVRRMLTRVLGNHDVVSAASGEEALAALEQRPKFDLILTDMTMPTMTGMQFYEALLAKDPDLAERVVFMSGNAVPQSANAFLSSVANPRIEKPFEVSALQQLVQQLMQTQQLRAAGAPL